MRVLTRVAVLAIFVVLAASTIIAKANGDPVDQTQPLQKSLLDAPSVKINVVLKRKTMAVHGQTEFDIFANPVVSSDRSSVLYDGVATFVENDSTLDYIFVDGAAYLVEKNNAVQAARCLPAVMEFDGILPALNNLTPIPSASIGEKDVECASGNLFQTTFSGTSFVLCASGARGFTVFGSDMTVTVEYLDNPVTISKPKLTDGTSSCSVLAEPMTVTDTTLALLTGDEIKRSTSRKLEEASHMILDADTCACKSSPRPCVFFPGLGNPTEEDALQDSYTKLKNKYGSIRGHAPCCSVVKYAVLNTADFKWTDDELQEKFCRHSLSMSASSDTATGVIENTIVVTHSMGGLVMAGALATGKCKFAESTSWVALSPPMTGSMAVDYLRGLCDDHANTLFSGVFELIGQCPVSIARQSTVYQGEKYSTPELDAKYVAAQEAYRGNVTAAMCSNYYVGAFSAKYQGPSVIAGETIPHKSLENDGLVEFQSCAVGLDPALFGTSYTSRFYMPQLNHGDTAFLTGEGMSDTQKPHKWFECLF